MGVRWRDLAALDDATAGRAVAATRSVHGVQWWTAVADVGQPNLLRIVLVIIAVGLLYPGQTLLAVWVILATVLETLVAPSAKFILDRPRPEWAHPLVHEAGTSFPSGHAAAAGTLLTIVVLLGATWSRYPALVRLAIVLATAAVAGLICASRIFLGVHYLSDVAGGLLLGSAMSLLCYVAVMREPSFRDSRATSQEQW